MTASIPGLAVITGLLGTACFACFTWGTLRHFTRVEKQSAGAWAISLLSLAVFILFLARLFVALFPERPAPEGLPPVWLLQWMLFGVSAALWTWTIRTTRTTPPSLAFSSDAPAQLFARGPYRWVRHPFYTAYLVFWAATALPSAGWRQADLAGAASFAMIGTTYLIAARYEERKFARSTLAQSYRSYAAQTGMFMPRFRARHAGDADA